MPLLSHRLEMPTVLGYVCAQGGGGVCGGASEGWGSPGIASAVCLVRGVSGAALFLPFHRLNIFRSFH